MIVWKRHFGLQKLSDLSGFVKKKIENPTVFMKKTRGYGDLLPLCVGRSVATRSLAIAAGGG